MNRRTFLLSAAVAWFRPAGAAGDDAVERRRRRVERRTEEWATAVDGCGYLDQPAFAIDRAFRGPQVPYDPQPGDVTGRFAARRCRTTRSPATWR
jgi:hypothetical protein